MIVCEAHCHLQPFLTGQNETSQVNRQEKYVPPMGHSVNKCDFLKKLKKILLV